MPDHQSLEPPASRLKLPKGYETPSADTPLLPWSHVVQRLESAQNYWLASTRPDGRPHVTPVWGVWVDNALYFDGIYTARWARNLAVNPAASVHLESGNDVVIVDGTFDEVVTDADLADRIIASWTAKYPQLLADPVGGGMYRIRPRDVRAWTKFPDDVTRYVFDDR